MRYLKAMPTPELITEAIARGGTPPEESVISPDEQKEADKICEQLYDECRNLLVTQGQKSPTSEESKARWEQEQQQERNLVITQQVRDEIKFLEDNRDKTGYLIGVSIPVDGHDPISVTLKSWGLPQSPEVTISVDSIASTRGFLVLNGEFGTLWHQTTGRWSDHSYPIRRANLRDARQFKEVFDCVKGLGDLKPFRFA